MLWWSVRVHTHVPMHASRIVVCTIPPVMFCSFLSPIPSTHVSFPTSHITRPVYASDLVWKPQGTQAERFASAPPTPVPPNILIAKMRPGQVIDMELHCEKGVGKEHIKWSPVCPASYRLLPEVRACVHVCMRVRMRVLNCQLHTPSFANTRHHMSSCAIIRHHAPSHARLRCAQISPGRLGRSSCRSVR